MLSQIVDSLHHERARLSDGTDHRTNLVGIVEVSHAVRFGMNEGVPFTGKYLLRAGLNQFAKQFIQLGAFAQIDVVGQHDALERLSALADMDLGFAWLSEFEDLAKAYAGAPEPVTHARLRAMAFPLLKVI